jgi:hypothetical protein
MFGMVLGLLLGYTMRLDQQQIIANEKAVIFLNSSIQECLDKTRVCGRDLSYCPFNKSEGWWNGQT